MAGNLVEFKVTFKQHVEKKITQVLKLLNQIERLLNTKRGLFFQVIRQLYITYISLVANYGVPV